MKEKWSQNNYFILPQKHYAMYEKKCKNLAKFPAQKRGGASQTNKKLHTFDCFKFEPFPKSFQN
jgi:hypothetical protein